MRHSMSRVAKQGVGACSIQAWMLYSPRFTALSPRSVVDTLNGKAAEERDGRGEAAQGR